MDHFFLKRIDQVKKRRIVFRIIFFNIEPTYINIKFRRILPHQILDLTIIKTQVQIQIGTFRYLIGHE
ncbi:hypothetical protein WT63_20800 [Burkholderia anthina]|nr:hypothetical protein WT63_20800 [Burkholderia anthina]